MITRPVTLLPARSRVFGVAVVLGVPILLAAAGCVLVACGWTLAGVTVGLTPLLWPIAAAPILVMGRVHPRHVASSTFAIWFFGWLYGIVVVAAGGAVAFWIELLRYADV
ncbi:MAG: hypothetical protein K2X32_14410 [Phycisphaerales bacterium]|nr:hypothetical protein [Phycisphaerales bacterium]